MLQEQRARPTGTQGLEETFHKPLGRRAFLSHTLRAGLAGGLVPSLASCTGPSSSAPASSSSPADQPISLTWIHEQDNDLYQQLVVDFQAHYPSIQIQHTPGDPDVASHYAYLISQLQQHQVDILSLDVTWIDEFVRQKWIRPLDQFRPLLATSQYLPMPVKAASVDGKLYAAPFRSDIGLLFYRTDLFSSPPTTWEELQTQASWAQSRQKTRYGYVWQGAPFEGLFCNFLEVYFGFGGSGLDLENPQTFTSDAAVQALAQMQQWISSGISPRDITNPIVDWTQDRALNEWRYGNAAFMRNWTFAIAQTHVMPTLPQVAASFDIAPLPGQTSSMGRSCIGGWQLAISSATSSAKLQAAWTFISYMMQHNAQEYAATQGGFLVTLKDIYRPDPIVTEQQPLVEKLPAILNKAGFRPQSPCYQQTNGASQIIYNQLHQALTNPRYLHNPQSALQDLQIQLEQAVCP